MNTMVNATPPQQPVNRLLWLAAAAGAEGEVRLHIARGEYLEWRDKRGLTPLMMAASRDRATICLMLLEAGVDLSARDCEGRDALAIARAAGALAAAEAIARWIPHQSYEARLTSPGITALPAEVGIEREGPLATIRSGDSTLLSVAIKTESLDYAAPEFSAIVEDGVAADLLADWEPAEPTPAPPDMPEFGRMEASRQRAMDQHRVIDTRASWDEIQEVAEAVEPAPGDLGDWEPAPSTTSPPDTPDLVQTEALRQRRIGEHAPIDRGAEWEEFEVALPESSTPLPRADDADFRADLRRLALLALREGSVPLLSIQDLFSDRGDAETRDLTAERQLLVTLGELGADADERLQHQVGAESFELFVNPDESEAETREVDEALAFFEELRSGRNDPLRIYLKSVGNRPLLNADQEAGLAKAMEAAVERALDALASWPAGLQALLDAVAGAAASPAILWTIVAIARDEAGRDDAAADVTEAIDAASPEDADSPVADFEAESGGSTADAVEAFEAIRAMAETLAATPVISAGIRARLATLRFRRPFLAKLVDLASGDRGAQACSYRDAIFDLLANREEMARANLRLVHAMARRYAHSGLSLDDLIQDGNLGLLKAVDRFDWRRGFRFSTMAVWWIRQQITRSIADTAFLIRPPVHVHEKVSRLRGLANAFESSHGREPTAAERARLLGVALQKFETIARPSSAPLSIEEADELGAFDLEAQRDPMDLVADRQIERLLAEKLSGLRRKSEAIMRMRTGVGVDDALTLEQVGSRFEVTRERVRQIEAKAMRTLASIRSIKELAIATGRPVPGRRATATAEGDEAGGHLDEAEEPLKAPGDRAQKSADPPGPKPAPRAITVGSDPAAPAALPSSIRQILDRARALGLEVDVTAEAGRASIFVAEVPQVDRRSRKLVRDMLELGFIHETGKGYRR